jgi:hypothetical protein
MRLSLVLCGLLVAATPAFAQAGGGAAQKLSDFGNYNMTGSYGGAKSGTSIMGNGASPGMSMGGSSLGNGNIGTSYGIGSKNAGTGITVDGSGFTDGMSSLPALSHEKH